MLLAERKERKVAIVKLRGKFNRDAVPEVAAKVREVCGDDRWLVMNLSGVTELVSAGIACLTEIRDWLRREGGRLALAECSRPAGEVLRITGLDALFIMMDSEAEAIEFISEEAEES